ncbi:MAG TPA: ACT domain-containing protein [Spirochaetota bacterium]
MKMIMIEMIVRNHPGVMSHIAGLFSRRNVSIEEIICRREGDATSMMKLLVPANDRVETIIKQLASHYDVIECSCRTTDNESLFDTICV